MLMLRLKKLHLVFRGFINPLTPERAFWRASK